MNFIDNIDFIFSLIWFKSCLLDEIAYIINSVVRCSINLDNIKHISCIKCKTILAYMTWISILQIFAINSFSKDTSTRCLTSSTRSREDIRVSNLTLLESTT